MFRPPLLAVLTATFLPEDLVLPIPEITYPQEALALLAIPMSATMALVLLVLPHPPQAEIPDLQDLQAVIITIVAMT